MDPKLSLSLMARPFEFGMRVWGLNFFHHSQKRMTMYSSLHQTVKSFPLIRGGLKIQIPVVVWAGSLLVIHIIVGALMGLVILDG
jgi:hypothetical protein